MIAVTENLQLDVFTSAVLPELLSSRSCRLRQQRPTLSLSKLALLSLSCSPRLLCTRPLFGPYRILSKPPALHSPLSLRIPTPPYPHPRPRLATAPSLVPH